MLIDFEVNTQSMVFACGETGGWRPLYAWRPQGLNEPDKEVD
jgi:hypothetical protein